MGSVACRVPTGLPASPRCQELATGKVLPVYIEEEMQKSYIDYAMSVIIQRALPDVRDGLKPVHAAISVAVSVTLFG